LHGGGEGFQYSLWKANWTKRRGDPSSRLVSYYYFVGPRLVPPAPVDDERAEEILQAHGGVEPTR